MAHSLELFFKTYLNLKEGHSPRNHELTKLCTACAAHDEHFLAYLEDPNWDIGTVDQWVKFWKYPDSKKRLTHSVWGTNDLFRLDSIARVVHLAVDPENSVETEIRRLILGHPISALALGDHDPAIKSLFLDQNDFFDEDGWPVLNPPEREWQRNSQPPG